MFYIAPNAFNSCHIRRAWRLVCAFVARGDMNGSLQSLCHDAPTCWNQHRNRWPKVIEASSRDLSWSELYKSSEQRTQVPFALYAIINLKNCIRQPEKPQCQKPLVQVMHSYSWIMELDFMNLLLHKWMHISNLVWIMVTHQAHLDLNQAKSMRRKARFYCKDAYAQSACKI